MGVCFTIHVYLNIYLSNLSIFKARQWRQSRQRSGGWDTPWTSSTDGHFVNSGLISIYVLFSFPPNQIDWTPETEPACYQPFTHKPKRRIRLCTSLSPHNTNSPSLSVYVCLSVYLSLSLFPLYSVSPPINIKLLR